MFEKLTSLFTSNLSVKAEEEEEEEEEEVRHKIQMLNS